MNRPRLVLTELRGYRSERTGNTYFSGYLGKARVVMLRDERAECTGKEVARWNILLEEPEPREDREARTGGVPSASRPPRRSAGPSNSRGGRPGARPAQQSTRSQQDRRAGTAADRAAGEFLREHGIDSEAHRPPSPSAPPSPGRTGRSQPRAARRRSLTSAPGSARPTRTGPRRARPSSPPHGPSRRKRNYEDLGATRLPTNSGHFSPPARFGTMQPCDEVVQGQ